MHQDIITSPRKGAPWFFRTVLLYPLKSRTTFQCIKALGGRQELNEFGSFGDAKTANIDELIGNRNQVPCIQTKYLMYFGIFSNLFGFGGANQLKPALLMSCAMSFRHDPRIPLHSRWDWRFGRHLDIAESWAWNTTSCMVCWHIPSSTLQLYGGCVEICWLNSVWMTLTFQKLVWDGEQIWKPGKIILFFQSRRQRSIDMGFLDGDWFPRTCAGGQVTHLDI